MDMGLARTKTLHEVMDMGLSESLTTFKEANSASRCASAMRTVTGKKKRRRMPSVCATCALMLTSAASAAVSHACARNAPALKK